MMLGAVNQGLDQLKWMVQDQTILLNGVVCYLKDMKTAMVEGQCILIVGQNVLVQEVLRLHSSVLDSTNIVWQVLTSLTCVLDLNIQPFFAQCKLKPMVLATLL